jgi:hypothetical protein
LGYGNPKRLDESGEANTSKFWLGLHLKLGYFFMGPNNIKYWLAPTIGLKYSMS